MAAKQPAPIVRDLIKAPVIGPFASAAELEQAILGISKGMAELAKSRLRRETIVLLLHDATRVGKRHIEYVLNALERLEEQYLKPVPAKKV